MRDNVACMWRRADVRVRGGEGKRPGKRAAADGLARRCRENTQDTKGVLVRTNCGSQEEEQGRGRRQFVSLATERRAEEVHGMGSLSE